MSSEEQFEGGLLRSSAWRMARPTKNWTSLNSANAREPPWHPSEPSMTPICSLVDRLLDRGSAARQRNVAH